MKKKINNFWSATKKIVKKSFDKDHKKVTYSVLGGIGAVVLVVILTIICINVFTDPDARLQKHLEKKLDKYAAVFWEDHYYDVIGKDEQEKKEFLERYSDNGISINLDNLSRNLKDKKDDIDKEFKNNQGKECDKVNTKVTFYPQDPYGKKNYKVKVELVCGFDKK